MKKKNEVKSIVKVPSENVQGLIQRAIDKGVPVETMERLLAMRNQLKAEFAKESFNRAMASFQSQCPVIQKTKIVKNKDGTIRYQYAPLDAIVAQTKELIKDNGLSYTIDTENKEGFVKAICRITHEAGHSETSGFEVPIDRDAYMNEQQKYASALTFAKRYAFCNGFGILTGDEDNDSNSLEVKKEKEPFTGGEYSQNTKPITEPQQKKIWAQIKQLGAEDREEAIEKVNFYLPADKQVKKLTDLDIASASQLIKKLEIEIGASTSVAEISSNEIPI
jgi:hypothetical protein